jgi:hypothetical protein
VAGTVAGLGVDEEGQTPLTEVGQLGRRRRLAADHDQGPGDVVGAVAVLPPGDGAPGVFEDTGVVAEAQEVIERRLGDGHATATSRASISAPARAR